MKKTTIVLLLIAVLALTACGSTDEKVIDGTVNNVTTGAADQGNSDGDVQTAPAESQEIQVKGYVFRYKGVDICMDAEAAPIVEAIGEEPTYYEAVSCAFEGLDKIYTYSGFELDTYPVEDVDYVLGVLFRDDSVATAEGVAIGDSLEKMEEAYGTDYTQEEGMLVYEKDGMKLKFLVKDDVITSIEYAANQ